MKVTYRDGLLLVMSHQYAAMPDAKEIVEISTFNQESHVLCWIRETASLTSQQGSQQLAGAIQQ